MERPAKAGRSFVPSQIHRSAALFQHDDFSLGSAALPYRSCSMRETVSFPSLKRYRYVPAESRSAVNVN